MKKLSGNQIRISFYIIALFMILVISDSCTKDTTHDMPGTGGNPGGTGPGSNEVWIQGSAFSPETITVTAGTTITWTNKESVIHTVTSNTGLFDSGNIGNNGTFTFKFTTAGSYLYHCTLHTTMNGKVTVN